jgi:hypothetical protein
VQVTLPVAAHPVTRPRCVAPTTTRVIAGDKGRTTCFKYLFPAGNW